MGEGLVIAFSVVKNLYDGLSGKASKKATKAAVAASQDATNQNNALAREIYADQKKTLQPFVAQGGPATSYINGLLGIGSPADSAAATAGFEGYKKSTGYASRLAEGTRAVTNNQAVSGLLNSGDTLKRLTRYGQDFASGERTNYFNELAGQQGVGLTAAGAQAGVATNYSSQVQNNNSVNASNIGNANLAKAAATNNLTTGILSAAASAAAASDRRLKVDIVRHGLRPDGLGDYTWTYIPELHSVYGSGRYRGVMADEVAAICPEKLGPVVSGFQTVRYDLVEPA